LEDGCIYVTYSDDAAGDYTDADELEWWALWVIIR
jgi:hypothetical protein